MTHRPERKEHERGTAVYAMIVHSVPQPPCSTHTHQPSNIISADRQPRFIAPSHLFCSIVTTTTTTVLWAFVRDYPGEPVPEETLTHPPSWSSNLYQLLSSTTIH